MDPEARASEARFADYVESLATALGHADRVEPLQDYCLGLLLTGERKSVEPMAAVVAPERTAAKVRGGLTGLKILRHRFFSSSVDAGQHPTARQH